MGLTKEQQIQQAHNEHIGCPECEEVKAKLIVYCEQIEKQLEEVKEGSKKIKQQNRDMMNVLCNLEWTDETINPKTCPWCLSYNPSHDIRCRLKKVLKEVNG